MRAEIARLPSNGSASLRSAFLPIAAAFLIAGAAPMYHDTVAAWGRARARRVHAATLAGQAEVLAVAGAIGAREHFRTVGMLRLAVDPIEATDVRAHAAALAADDPAALQAASVQLELAELLVPAADAAAQAAELYRQRAEPAATAVAAARAGALARTCGTARTPALLAAATPFRITRREREVATLAATGLSNREIAQRLQVSVRTVEGHIYRACTKLGVGDRATLADWLAAAQR